MTLNNRSILEFLNGSIQFKIPLYQRHYAWDKKECNDLFNDLKTLYGNQKRQHFIGMIVRTLEETKNGGLIVSNVIDGQQRLITITLLIVALRDFLRENKKLKIGLKPDSFEQFLFNRIIEDEDINLKYKIFPNEYDRKFLFDKVDNANDRKSKIEFNTDSKIESNYSFFYDLVSRERLYLKDLYNSINRLCLVDVLIGKEDDPQGIFESLNSKGKNIEDSERIKNYILMGLESNEQEYIYKNYWSKIESSLKHDNKYLNEFFRDFLIMKYKKIINTESVYVFFKNQKTEFEQNHETEFKNIREFCEDILDYATWYSHISYCNSENDELNELYMALNQIKITTHYSFLLQIHHDCFRKKIISLDDMKKIINLLISYLIRSKICRVPSRGKNFLFITLLNRINKDDYVNSIIAYFIFHHGHGGPFPSDEIFLQAFLETNVYHGVKNLTGYVLQTINNFSNENAQIKYSDKKIDGFYTIEHIMPQDIHKDSEWIQELGENWREIHSKYCNTIGNLTLISHNYQANSKSFETKLNMKDGLRDSQLEINNYINNQISWGEKQIIDRAKKLAEKAKNIWQYPYMSDDRLSYYKKEYSTIYEE